ncbi:hypothetical protein ACN8ZM_28335 [Burkholderia aenigmatica]|uniref:hypothetical protein n=1 Tax=Burkholderia aenigmatica TaxID=2015348 RepID=UPI003B433419
MTPEDKFPTTPHSRDPLLPRDIAVLESAVQCALESFQHVAAHYSRLTAIARFAPHVEMRDEDRRYVLQKIRELTELGEEDLQRRHDALRMAASRYWRARYGGDANRSVRH